MKKIDFSYSFPLRVRYAETDPQGIVFNANYLVYFDVAVTEYFRAKGHAYNDFLREHSVDFHVIRSVIDYKSPARFDDLLDIYIRGEYQGVKILWTLAIFHEENLICTGELTYAAFDVNTKKLRKLEEKIMSLVGVEKSQNKS